MFGWFVFVPSIRSSVGKVDAGGVGTRSVDPGLDADDVTRKDTDALRSSLDQGIGACQGKGSMSGWIIKGVVDQSEVFGNSNRKIKLCRSKHECIPSQRVDVDITGSIGSRDDKISSSGQIDL
jgi:hypothetical protein